MCSHTGTVGTVLSLGQADRGGGGASVGAESPCSRHHGGRGSCCHCQILSRAAGRKQQMVELVPEQRVKPRQCAVCLFW